MGPTLPRVRSSSSKTSNVSETPETETRSGSRRYSSSRTKRIRKTGKVHSWPTSLVNEDPKGEVNIEASVTVDDVIRASGFGATDGIGSFLPVAMDATNFGFAGSG